MNYNTNNWFPDQQQSPESYSDVAANSVQDAQALLSMYPVAPTPTAHVTRHLSNLSMAANPPSFVQNNYYTLHASFAPSNQSPYINYEQELSYLASSAPSNRDSAYWERARNNAGRLIGEQAGRSYPYPQINNTWLQPLSQSNSYATNPMAQSLFQQMVPVAAYPTPPPPHIPTSSSSSLANALGPPPQGRYRPDESANFFESFLTQKTNELKANVSVKSPSTPPQKHQALPQIDSPDPLALSTNSSRKFSTVTPSKRKAYVQLTSPSVKRVQSVDSFKRGLTESPSSTTPSTPGSVVPPTPSTIFGRTLVPKTPSDKRLRLNYVSVPPALWLTPISSRKSASNLKQATGESPDDLDAFSSPTRRNEVQGSARRTGDRDDRAPLDKFATFLEDIFEAEDSLAPDADINDLPTDFWSTTSINCSNPYLSPAIIRKLTQNIGHISRPSKRIRSTGAQATPKGKGRMSEVDLVSLNRVLKLLKRSVKAGEDLNPLAYDSSYSKNLSSRKSPEKKAGKAQKSDTVVEEDPADAQELTDEHLTKLANDLELARNSVLAAECCISLLASDRLPKQLYSEELITDCLGTIKNQLTNTIYPFVEAAADPNTTLYSSPLVQYLAKELSHSADGYRKLLGEIFQILLASLPRINTLMGAESVSMSDSIVISAVYISIAPFFIVDGSDADGKVKKENMVTRIFGRSAMRGLRLETLSLIRSIFASRSDQRSWIIEEILGSLIKLSDTKQKAGQFRLRDGRSIRTVSALLLQLVQTSAHDVRLAAKVIQTKRRQQFALKRQESLTESQVQQQASSGPLLDEIDQEEIRLYNGALDSALKVAKSIILFLTQRSGKGKSTKNSNEAEYRAIFDNLIHDVLAVLHWPEWPAASLFLSIACKYMVSSLDDVKASHQDNNAAKTMALDHLGVIAARIRSTALKIEQNESLKYKGLRPIETIVSDRNSTQFDKVLDAHQDVFSHLCKRASDDQAYDSAQELTSATLGQELAVGLTRVWDAICNAEEDEDRSELKKLYQFGKSLKMTLSDVWKEPATDVFDVGSDEEAARVDRLSEEIGSIQGLRNSFQPILNVILTALDAPAIFMRSKALRALGQIVTSDASILSTSNVRRAIEGHLLDSSSAVRDAAVELIGKYMVDAPEVARSYYPKISERIADTGLGVRKRVIKLLKAYYIAVKDPARQRDIATRLILRLGDEDESVKDLAVKTVEELWFPSSMSSGPMKTRPNNMQEKAYLLDKVSVIMGVSSNFKDQHSPLEDILHKIIIDRNDNETASLHSQYVTICEALIDGLVDASDLPGFTVINCIRTIYLFASAYPAVLSGSNATTLLPYLKNTTTAEEQMTSDYLLKIFRVTIPHMPRTTAKFGLELQTTLQPMVLKPTSTNANTMQELIACLCAVVQHLTHEFSRLVTLLRSCNARLQSLSAKDIGDQEIRQLNLIIFIVSLLAEHCDFDQMRTVSKELNDAIDTITKGSVIEHVYRTLLKLYAKSNDSGLRGRLLTCLGFLFRAHPTLMTQDSSALVMDQIFCSEDDDGRARLLRIMQEFLTSEAAKHSAQEKDAPRNANAKPSNVNMEELVGNTDGFADSGVSSAIVQRYLTHILEAAVSSKPSLQSPAIDILNFTVKQGLAHPLQSFPIIVALETSPNSAISSRANLLHLLLHSKHVSLLNARYTASARASFDYQTKILGDVKGYRLEPSPVALLQRWYSLVRDKRATRQEFLKSMVKIFQEDGTEISQSDVDFIRYMAENFATFEYKTLEEVLTVIKSLTSILSTNGAHLLNTISPAHLLSHLKAQDVDISDVSETNLMPFAEKVVLMRSSVVIGMVMLLKAYLKQLYGLTEEKCSKFIVGKKSALGDRAASKRSGQEVISWDRMKYATKAILTTEDVNAQRADFVQLWNEDGVSAEPDEDEFDHET